MAEEVFSSTEEDDDGGDGLSAAKEAGRNPSEMMRLIAVKRLVRDLHGEETPTASNYLDSIETNDDLFLTPKASDCHQMIHLT